MTPTRSNFVHFPVDYSRPFITTRASPHREMPNTGPLGWRSLPHSVLRDSPFSQRLGRIDSKPRPSGATEAFLGQELGKRRPRRQCLTTARLAKKAPPMCSSPRGRSAASFNQALFFANYKFATVQVVMAWMSIRCRRSCSGGSGSEWTATSSQTSRLEFKRSNLANRPSKALEIPTNMPRQRQHNVSSDSTMFLMSIP